MIMGFLSNLFSSDDSTSSNSNDLVSDLTGSLAIDFSNESYSHEVDEDGNEETSYDSTSFSTDLDLDNILSSMTDNWSHTDGDSSGGGFLGG
jgi:hypothetical protein